MAAVAVMPTFEELVRLAMNTYEQSYGCRPEIASCAPGRVNLIGEHIDYCDGFVLPMALPMLTVIVGSRNCCSETMAEVQTCCLEADGIKRIKFDTLMIYPDKPKDDSDKTVPVIREERGWINYVKGVIHSYNRPVPSFNAVIASNVPVGGGLSSSAALEVSVLTFLEKLTGDYIYSESEKALICQRAEHTFAGVPCGIMDQTISVSGRKDNVLLIDCQSLETYQIPFEAKNIAVLICNSNVRHELSSSEYPTRRKQCSEALKLMGLTSYREATEEHLKELENAEEVLLKRARHVITEIKRTQEAAEALKSQNFEHMGELMKESHKSLRDDFEVSCPELDLLVESANNCEGVLGSRMTGGGFGGCTVTLLKTEVVDDVVKQLYSDFTQTYRFTKRPLFYLATPSEGTRVINIF